MAFLYRAFTTREETISFGLTTGFDRGSPKRTSSWNFEGALLWIAILRIHVPVLRVHEPVV